MPKEYDAIVVGARCAGSPTAMLLARLGYRVLLVDHASFPSDTLSTHMIHAPGVAALSRWGLLERVIATGCPPIDRYAFDFGFVTISGTPAGSGGVSVGYAPRRSVLDKILVDAADEAGAEVRERFSFEGLVRSDDGTVTGIRGHGPDGATVVERARVVIGADGRNSPVARAVSAPTYHEKPQLQVAYYSYWSGLPGDTFEAIVRPDRAWGVIPTNDGLTVVVVGWPHAEAAAYRSDIEGNYLKTLQLSPEFAERMRGATREERFAGGALPNFFRKPYGPGWVLVGDAGYTKDPITAQGISDAFRDADACAVALDRVFTGGQSFDTVMAAYQQIRDTQALPIYEFTTQLATLAPPPPEVAQLLAAVAGSPAAMNAFASMVAGTLSPEDFFAPEHIGEIMAAAATMVG